MDSAQIKSAILGTGNIGTDLLYKLLREPGSLELALFAGIDPASEGLKRARSLGVKVSHEGAGAILKDPEVKIVFDATSAHAHRQHAPKLQAAGKTVIDLTPAALGPYVVPLVNLEEHAGAGNLNLITCGGQATIPMVHAVSRITEVAYAEIVSTVSSVSAGPGTRQNIDEFTFTTARGLEQLGGAEKGKAIIILNPADPPILMRNTIYVLPKGDFDKAEVTRSIVQMAEQVAGYVPGYRVKGEPVYDEMPDDPNGRKIVTILLEVEGAGDFLPPYAGNLDIMTASAWRVGQQVAKTILAGGNSQ
jgi:acetaldehyde dehydrogenase